MHDGTQDSVTNFRPLCILFFLLFIYSESKYVAQKNVLTIFNLIFIWTASEDSDLTTSKTACVFILKMS